MAKREVDDPTKWVQLSRIADRADLDGDDRLAILTTAITQLGVAMSLTAIHGAQAGYTRYMATDPPVRFDTIGDVYVRHPSPDAAS